MKKILWFCNRVFSEKNNNGGSWLQPLAEELNNNGVNIINVSFGNIKEIESYSFNGIKQWIIPKKKQKGYGQLSVKSTLEEIKYIFSVENPDLVHIWGTESVWASIIYNNLISRNKILLDIQGLLFACEKFYYGGLSFSEVVKCINLKEILLPNRMLFFKKYIFHKRGIIEKNILKNYENISTQSEWVRAHIKQVSPTSKLYNTNIILRKKFYTSPQWIYKKTEYPTIFSICAAAVSYKGAHILLKAVSILKEKYPNIKVRLAGNIIIGNRLKDGYSLYLLHLIKKLNLTDNIIFLGNINEDNIINELYNCNVCVIPSFVETYCLAFAESMAVGVPTVVSFAGAMPELAVNMKEAIFYSPLDYNNAAYYIQELIENKELAEFISKNARKRRLEENNIDKVVKNQLNIYNEILSNV